jgi:hypothetical protein
MADIASAAKAGVTETIGINASANKASIAKTRFHIGRNIRRRQIIHNP